MYSIIQEKKNYTKNAESHLKSKYALTRTKVDSRCLLAEAMRMKIFLSFLICDVVLQSIR